MISIRWIFFTASLLLLDPTIEAQATFYNRTRSCVKRALKTIIVDPMSVDLQGRVLLLHPMENPGNQVSLELGRSLGSGFVGRAYEIKNIKGYDLPQWSGEPLVAKIGHSWKFNPSDISSRKAGQLHEEFATYNLLMNQSARVWRDSVMRSKSEAWEIGRLPIARIYGKLETRESGPILIKSLIKGMSLSEIYARYGDSIANLPTEMRSSLRDVYDLAQAVHRTVKVPNGSVDQALAYSPDIKPENFIWVTDSTTLKANGLKRPGFLFVEFTHHPSANWIYDSSRTPFEKYERIMEKYLRFKGKGK